MTKQQQKDNNNNPLLPSDSWLPEFSNCFIPAASIQIDGKTYPSTEHYYQARKFRDAASIDKILSQDNPIRAKFAANKLSNKARKRQTLKPGTFPEGRPIHMLPETEWTQTKEAVMFEATFAKYRQHPKLQKLLLSTGNRELIEPNVRDAYWGCGPDDKGQNRLGHVLMEVRRVLSKEQQQRQQQETSLENVLKSSQKTKVFLQIIFALTACHAAMLVLKADMYSL